MGKYSEFKISPKTAYILRDPKPKAEGLPRIVPVHVVDSSSDTTAGAKSRHKAGNVQEQRSDSSSSSESSNRNNTSSERSAEDPTSSQRYETDWSFMREREKVRYHV